jgi:heme/copper-type cytochrome/quinol oxidase subunit 2
MGVYSQIWRRIYQAITLHSSASADNISGLLWIIFTILVVVLSLAVLIVQLVYNIVKVAKEKKKQGTGGRQCHMGCLRKDISDNSSI